MAVFGFRYQSASISTYSSSSSSSVRSESVTKPFAPFVPKFNSGNGYRDEKVGKTKQIPVGRRPYEYESDDEWKHERGTNPALASPPKAHPPTSLPVTSPHYIKDYDNHHAYGYNNKEAYKPKPTATPVYDDGDYKPKPISTPDYNDGYGADYGDYNNKERYKPKSTFTPVYNDGHAADYGDYNNKERYKPRPSGTPVYNDGFGADYGRYNNKEGYKPKPSGSPVRDNGYGDDYGTYRNKERSKPNDGRGGDYGNYSKEGPKPKSIEIPVSNNGYGIGGPSPAGRDYGGYGNYPNNIEGNKLTGPKTTPGWSETPRKGTPLSKPMNDIDEAIEMLKKEAAMRNGNERGYNGGPKLYDSKPYYDGPDGNGNERDYYGGPKPYEKKANYDGPGPLGSRPAPGTRTNEKNMNLVNESEKLKKIVTKGPQTPTASKGNSRPLFNFNDGVMDHKEAERKFNGITI